MDASGNLFGQFELQQLFFAQHLITSSTIDEIFRGMQHSPMKRKDVRIIDDVRNLLVLDPSNREVKLDLYSLNLQPGRDHGIGSYNAVRRAFGLPAITNFA